MGSIQIFSGGMNFMRILLTAAVAASFAVGSLSALAQTPPKPDKPVACKKIKEEAACTTRADCSWTAPTGKQKTGKCAAAKKK
jgi:hypothetical protein